MEILALIISCAALILSVGASAIAVKCRIRLDALEARKPPGAQAKGAGGGGW